MKRKDSGIQSLLKENQENKIFLSKLSESQIHKALLTDFSTVFNFTKKFAIPYLKTFMELSPITHGPITQDRITYGAGGADAPPVLADKLTLFPTRETDYDHHITT